MKKLLTIILGVGIMVTVFAFSHIMSTKRMEHKELPQAKLKDEYLNKKKDTFALMLENEDGEYEISDGELPTEGYRFNEEKSGCIDINGLIVDNVLSYDYDNYILTVDTGKTVYCYLYYDIDVEKITPLELKEKDASVLANVGGMYRYQGTYTTNEDGTTTDNINNYICLGVSCNTDKIDEEEMYRIIGITSGGQIKVIKKTVMKIGTRKTFVWIAPASSNTKWPDSDLFHQLNDNGSGTYATSSFYYKLDSTLKSHIDDTHEWKYGSTTATDNVSYNGSTMYALENGFTTKKAAPIGVIYIHDYLLSYKGGNPSNKDNAKNAWIFLENNDDTIYSTSWREWTMARHVSLDAWYVSYGGGIFQDSTAFSFAVRPVFYLKSDITLSGDGNLSNPYKIVE